MIVPCVPPGTTTSSAIGMRDAMTRPSQGGVKLSWSPTITSVGALICRRMSSAECRCIASSHLHHDQRVQLGHVVVVRPHVLGLRLVPERAELLSAGMREPRAQERLPQHVQRPGEAVIATLAIGKIRASASSCRTCAAGSRTGRSPT